MSLSLKYEVDGDFLLVTMSGQFTLNDACWAFREVLSTSARHGATKVMFDCLQMWGNIPTAERYALGDFAARELISFIEQHDVSPRLAVLAAEPLLDPNRFAELVARNRGVEIKIVEQMEKGLKWLGVERERYFLVLKSADVLAAGKANATQASPRGVPR